MLNKTSVKEVSRKVERQREKESVRERERERERKIERNREKARVRAHFSFSGVVLVCIQTQIPALPIQKLGHRRFAWITL